MLRIFTPVKIQRLRPGLNPQSWVPEASMLPGGKVRRRRYTDPLPPSSAVVQNGVELYLYSP